MVDYIREELLRQRQAWSALLRSGQQTEKEEPPRSAGAAAEEALLPVEAAGSGRPDGLVPAVSAPAAWAEPESRRKKTPPRRSRGAAEERTSTAADMGTAAPGAGVHPALRALRPETAGEAGVKELSRIIQRDSRRYDGGFTLY